MTGEFVAMRREFVEPAVEVGGDIQGLPIRFADGAAFEDHGASIWAVCYVRRIVDGQSVIINTEVIAFPRDGFMETLLSAIEKMLPDKGHPVTRLDS